MLRFPASRRSPRHIAAFEMLALMPPFSQLFQFSQSAAPSLRRLMALNMPLMPFARFRRQSGFVAAAYFRYIIDASFSSSSFPYSCHRLLLRATCVAYAIHRLRSLFSAARQSRRRYERDTPPLGGRCTDRRSSPSAFHFSSSSRQR